MSACLFTISYAWFKNATTDDLKSLIKEQQDCANHYDVSNRFECDRAAGYTSNIELATLELKGREYFSVDEGESLTALVQREGGDPNNYVMRAAVGYFHHTKEPVTITFDGNWRIK